MAITSVFDRSGGAAGLDVYDTIDDYNNACAFPTQNPGSWFQQTGQSWLRDSVSDTGAGGGTTTGTCDGTEDCVYKDQLTGLYWSKGSASSVATWESAITYCENLSYGTYTNWRLPTAKEMSQAHIDGIWSIKTAMGLTDKLILVGFNTHGNNNQRMVC